MADSVVIRITGDDSSFQKTLSGVKSKISGLGKASSAVFKGMAVGIGAISTVLSAAGVAAVKYNGTIEQLQTSFEVMTGSAEEAAEIIDRIRTLGAETPFETGDLATVTQLLMNYGLTADEALSRMTVLGDIAQGDADKLLRIATAYGQMSSAGKVALEDVKQMIEAGFNPLQIIAEATGESMASLYDRISSGTLAVEEITNAMVVATSEGGRYYQSMQAQARTLNGMLSTLKDNAQQLLGNLFEPVSDGLRDNVLPEAIALIDELTAAYERGGLDGFADKLTDAVPDIVDSALAGLGKLIDGVAGKLPGLVKKLVKKLPRILRTAISTGDGLVDALFDIVSGLAEGVVGMLPELAPMLVDGLFGLLGSVFEGLLGVIGGLFKGLGTALKKIGVLDWSAQELVEQAFENVDEAHVDDIIARINIEPEVEVEEPEVELRSIYEQVAQTLTDGEADTEEIIEALQTRITEYYQNQVDRVNEWRAAAIAGIDSSLPEDEIASLTAEINTQADEMIARLGTASDVANAFVTDMAGRPTAIVEANLSTLDGYLADAEAIVAQVYGLIGDTSGSILDAQRDIVSRGMTQDEGVQINALAATAEEYASAVADAEAIYTAALEDAAENWRTGNITEAEYRDLERAAMEEREAALASAQQTHEQNMIMLMKGIAMATDPEAYDMIESVQVAQAIRGRLNAVTEGIEAAFAAGSLDGLDGEAFKNAIMEQFAAAGITAEDWQTMADAMGLDADTMIHNMLGQLYTQISSGAASIERVGNIFDYLRLDESGLFDFDEGQLTELASQMAPIITAASEAGLLEGLENIDFTDPQQLLDFLATDYGVMFASTIGQSLTDAGNEADATISPEVALEPDVSGAETISDAVEDAVDAATADPVMAEQTVEATVTPSTDESAIEDAVQTELDSQSMTVDVDAAVSLNVTVSDSNATAVGTTVGVELGEALRAGVASKSSNVAEEGSNLVNTAAANARSGYSSMKAAGEYTGSGFAKGLASKRAEIIAVARSIASAVSNTIRSALDIHSPSGVTEYFGEMTGEGFEIGAVRSFGRAVRQIERTIGAMNLRPQLSAPDFSGMLDSAVSSAMSIGEQRPIILQVNSKTLARVMTGNMQAATNAANKEVYMGYGK